jgi:glycerophosphoryl diester phosphodiesterase
MDRAFELQGHRGARGLFAENTLDGFIAAAALGVSSVELDVGVTRDGVVAINHDFALNPDIARGPDGRWLSEGCDPPPLIRSLSLAELRRFDVGRIRPGSELFRRHPGQCGADGVVVPTLAELVAATAASATVLDIELKTEAARPDDTVAPEAMAEAVLQAARAAAGRIVVRSFDWRGLAWLQRHAPDTRLAWLSQGQTDPAGVLAASRGSGTWAPAWADLSPGALRAAQAGGLRVVPWTVNIPDDMRRLIAWGVDGLCTDRPDLARAAMKSCNLTPPPGSSP